ncbi:unnamed protein product [Gadus morhua 'NCC']
MNVSVTRSPLLVLSRTPYPAGLLRPQGPRSTRRIHLRTTTSTAPHKYKTIDELPGPTAADTAYLLFVKGYADKSHAMQTEFRGRFGPLWRSRFGPLDLVNVASPELVLRLLDQEGARPVRVELSHWREYREARGRGLGLHVSTGDSWLRLRRALDPLLLRPAAALGHAPALRQVVEDLLARLERLRLQRPDGGVANMQEELYKFGFESVAAVVFEARLGCLQDRVPEETLRFIAALNAMWRLSEPVLLLPCWTRGLLPYWGRFVRAWDDITQIADGLIERRLLVLEERSRRGAPAPEGAGLLTALLTSKTLPREEVYTTVTELLLGGVDTTSNTLCWALYHLSRDPRAQHLLHQEALSECPDLQEPMADHLTRLPYLKAVVKETLRLYPVVPGNGRLVLENEVYLEDYCFPRGTQFHLCHYVTGRDEAQFRASESFLPERWLRGGAGESRLPHHPYSSIPFGRGVRGCVGKRVAQLEMYLALFRIMQHYQVLPQDPEEVVEAKTRTLMIPGKPINLRFIPRA